MSIPRNEEHFRLMSGYRAVKGAINQAILLMLNLANMVRIFHNATTYDVTESGSPTDAHGGHIWRNDYVGEDAARCAERMAYFQGANRDLLDGLMGKVHLVWVDDVVI